MNISRRNLLLLSGSAATLAAHRSQAKPTTANPILAKEYSRFTEKYPNWLSTESIEELRINGYTRLKEAGEAYLDYTGGSLQSDYQTNKHIELLNRTVMGNPHSVNKPSMNSSKFITRARTDILKYFNASPNEYEVVFTANATNAIKLVGEHFPFSQSNKLLLSDDNHNSVNGISAFAKHAGASIERLPISMLDLRIDDNSAKSIFAKTKNSQPGLFAYPAQSNFSGVRHSLDLIAEAHKKGWDVLLDAAAFAPTNSLDLTKYKPDYVCISFYKMFGYPTGIGCLIAKREKVSKWNQKWYAGGNIKLYSVAADDAIPAPSPASFEDGTLDYLMIPAVSIGLDYLNNAGLEKINERVRCLTSWTLDKMQELHHKNGKKLIRLYGPSDTIDRGSTIAFSIVDPNGRAHDIRKVCMLASSVGVSLRSGYFCNPGAGETAQGVTREMIKPLFAKAKSFNFDELRAFMRDTRGFDIGAVRASFGIVSNFTDAYRLYDFLRNFTNNSVSSLNTYPSTPNSNKDFESGA